MLALALHQADSEVVKFSVRVDVVWRGAAVLVVLNPLLRSRCRMRLCGMQFRMYGIVLLSVVCD